MSDENEIYEQNEENATLKMYDELGMKNEDSKEEDDPKITVYRHENYGFLEKCPVNEWKMSSHERKMSLYEAKNVTF